MNTKLVLANEICSRLGITPSPELPQRHGEICLANDSLLGQANWAPVPTTWAIGYDDPNRNQLRALLDYIAPPRPSARKAIVRVYDEDEPFETADYTKVKRNPLAEFAEVKQRTATTATRLIPNRGLTVRLDRDQIAEDPNWQTTHTTYLMDLLMRASVLEVLALYATIATTDTWTWNSGSNPDLDVKSAITTALAPAVGFYPNRGLYGDEATLQRQIAYEPQDNAGAYAAAAQMSDAGIATRAGLAEVRTNAERYNNSAGSKVTFLGKKVLLFNAVPGAPPADPSNIVRQVASATFGGGNYATYITEQGVKTIFLTVENYELPVVQHTGGVLLSTIN